MNPLISIIVPAYNRSKTIARTIDSILIQTYQNFEIIIVDDGSEDNTLKILENYEGNQLRILHHSHNKGVTAAKNTGLNNIKGEWFTIIDSDDEIVPEALDTMMKIPLEMDCKVTAISCNCLDSSTGKFSGGSLTSDGYVDFKTLITTEREGDYWGITKTELLLNDRLNERLMGFESVLWFKINERANRYYIHKPLLIYHTEENNRISKVHFSFSNSSNHFEVLAEETHYLRILKTYQPSVFAKDCLWAVIYLKADDKKEFANFYFSYLKKIKNHNLYKVFSFFIYYSPPLMIRKSLKFWKEMRSKK